MAAAAAAAASSLSRGAVALCALFSLRLQRGRRLREAARRLRCSRHRRALRRRRHRFAALCLAAQRGPGLASASAPSPCGRERRLWSKARSSAFWETVRCKAFSRREWVQHFRLSPATFDFLCGRLRAAIERRDTSMRRAVPPEIRLALTLWRLGACAEYRAVEERFGVSRSTVCQILRDVCQAVVAIFAPLYASPPRSASQFPLPQLAGVFTRLRVPIRAPPTDAALYSVGRGCHAVVLQAAVDAHGRFWAVEVTRPGVGIQASALYARAQSGALCPAPPLDFGGLTVPPYLLGRPGDPLLPWLLHPYGKAESGKGRGRRRFDAGAAAAQMAAASALGRLRGRWRCLQRRNDTDLGFLPTLLLACCLLHNVCQARGDPCPMATPGIMGGMGWAEGVEEEGEALEEEDEEEVAAAAAAAQQIRDAVAAAMQG